MSTFKSYLSSLPKLIIDKNNTIQRNLKYVHYENYVSNPVSDSLLTKGILISILCITQLIRLKHI